MSTSPRSLDPKGTLAGAAAFLVLGLSIILGSRNLRHFDPLLLTYTFGVLFSAFAIAYRYAVWLQRPPTWEWVKRGWELLRRGPFPGTALYLMQAATLNLGAQRFIRKRSFMRWLIHFLIAWGTLIACAVTFPLVFGWLHFTTRLDDPETYRVMLFDVCVGEFGAKSLLRFVFFNALNLSAVMVIAGVGLALHRRLRDAGPISRQQFGNDIVPLLLLLAISLTGAMLTFCAHFLRGAGYTALSLVHAVAVSATLLYIPFGKFFHVLQRPLHLAVILARRNRESEPAASCRGCGAAFAQARHLEGLRQAASQSGFLKDLDHCPRCKRRRLGLLGSRTREGEPARG